MRVLIMPSGTDYGMKLIEKFRQEGHNVWVADSKNTKERVRNFIKVNPVNFEALALAVKLASPEEVHVVCERSILRNIHILLAVVRARKVVFYFQEENVFIETIAKTFSREFGFTYDRGM